MDSDNERVTAEVDDSLDVIGAAEALLILQRSYRNSTFSPLPPCIPLCALRWGSNRRSRYPSRVNNNPPPPTVQSPNTPLSWSSNNTSASADKSAASGDFSGPESSCSIPSVVVPIAGRSCSGPIFKVSKCFDLPDLNLPYANMELELGLSSSVDH